MPSQGRIVVKDFPKPSEMAPVSMLEAGPKRREDAKVAPGLGRRQSSVHWVAVKEPLALGHADGQHGPLAVLHLAGVVAEVKLAQVAVQVPRADVVVGAVNGPLQL